MKNIRIILFLLLSTLLYNCDSKVDRPDPVLSQDQITQQNQNSTPASVVGNTGGAVLHYYCSNNCAGSGGDVAGNCPVCGTAYVHNQAFHNNDAIQTNTTPVPEPAQNSSGVWHYICSNGCSGGSSSASACSQCGSTLVHNTLYHN